MTNLRINDNSYTEVTRPRDPNDRWSGEKTYTSHDIESFRVVDDNDYDDVSVAFDIEEGRDYYLLYTIYSTGDSFSRHDGAIKFIDLYETKEMAEENRQRIVKHYEDKNDENYSVELQLEDGCNCPKDLPVCLCGFVPQMKSVFRKPLVPTKEEIDVNPMARSSKLRVAQKV